MSRVIGWDIALFAAGSEVSRAHAPRAAVTSRVQLADRWLHEGQSTRLRVRLESARDLEQVTITLAPPAFMVPQPPSGMVPIPPHGGPHDNP